MNKNRANPQACDDPVIVLTCALLKKRTRQGYPLPEDGTYLTHVSHDVNWGDEIRTPGTNTYGPYLRGCCGLQKDFHRNKGIMMGHK